MTFSQKGAASEFEVLQEVAPPLTDNLHTDAPH